MWGKRNNITIGQEIQMRYLSVALSGNMPIHYALFSYFFFPADVVHFSPATCDAGLDPPTHQGSQPHCTPGHLVPILNTSTCPAACWNEAWETKDMRTEYKVFFCYCRKPTTLIFNAYLLGVLSTQTRTIHLTDEHCSRFKVMSFFSQ